MKSEIWEFLVGGNRQVIRRWMEEEKLSTSERAKLDYSLDRLRSLDFGLLSSKLLAGPLRGTKIYKLRLRCENRELRPMLCRGPVGPPHDYTLLEGSIEVGRRMRPADAEDRAMKHRADLISNPGWRARY